MRHFLISSFLKIIMRGQTHPRTNGTENNTLLVQNTQAYDVLVDRLHASHSWSYGDIHAVNCYYGSNLLVIPPFRPFC